MVGTPTGIRKKKKEKKKIGTGGGGRNRGYDEDKNQHDFEGEEGLRCNAECAAHTKACVYQRRIV
jgi:hypothetical protein